MNISDEMKNEIRERFSILERKFELEKIVQRRFFNHFEVWKSEVQTPFPRMTIGALYELTDEEKNIIEAFETMHGGKVYHMILSAADDHRHYSLLYVSKYPEEWSMDKDDLIEGCPFVYVYNPDDIRLSEFGSIAIRKGFGGIVRIT